MISNNIELNTSSLDNDFSKVMNIPYSHKVRNHFINGSYVNELSNAEGVDDIYYGITASQGTQIATAGITLLDTVSSIKKAPKTELESNIKTHCGKRPFFIGKRRKKFDKCKENLLASIASKEKADQDLENAKIKAQLEESQIKLTEPKKSSTVPLQSTSRNEKKKKPSAPPPPPPPKKKSYTGLIIGVSAFILIGGFVTWKLIKNRQAISVPTK